jgi:hypothetical protein
VEGRLEKIIIDVSGAKGKANDLDKRHEEKKEKQREKEGVQTESRAMDR